LLTGGEVHDVTQAEALLEDQSGRYVIADKGYDSSALVEQINGKDMVAVIPPRSNRKTPRAYDKHLYKERNVIERTFNKLKNLRRIATRFERTKINFMALLHVASIMLWLR
jgi:transposase